MKNMGLPLALFIVSVSTAACVFSWFLLYQTLHEKEYRIIKTDPCLVENLQEGIELATSGSPCDPVKVKDISGYKIPDDVDEFSIHYNIIGRQPQPKPKYYKRNDDGIFKEVKAPPQE